jgi:hypothetical protein
MSARSERSEQVAQNETVTTPGKAPEKASRLTESRKKVKALFAEWLAMPEPLRDPKTQKEFAERNAISRISLWNWKKAKDFQDRVISLSRTSALFDYADYMGFLKKQAEAGSVAAIELYLNHVHGWSRKISVGDKRPMDFRIQFGDEEDSTQPWFMTQPKSSPKENGDPDPLDKARVN